MAVKMKIARDFGAYFKYSLHDARIKEMEYKDGSLILHFDYIFSYDEGAEHTHKAQIIFEQVAIDDVDVLVFSDTLLEKFQGKRIDFETYQSSYDTLNEKLQKNHKSVDLLFGVPAPYSQGINERGLTQVLTNMQS